MASFTFFVGFVADGVFLLDFFFFPSVFVKVFVADGFFFVRFCFFPSVFLEGQRNYIKKNAERHTSVAFYHTQSKATSLFRRTRGLFQGGAELEGAGWGR